MNADTVRATLAYGITFGFFALLVLVLFVPLTGVQMTVVTTMIGALLANWKMPLAYFYDGLPESVKPQPKPPSPGDTNAPPA